MRLAAVDLTWLSLQLHYDYKPLDNMSAEEASTVARMVATAAVKSGGEKKETTDLEQAT